MKQNLRKKALFPAVAMVLASVIALSGVTYAWFTTGTTGKVTGLDVNVQTAKGIQVSLDAAGWKSLITADDILTAMDKANGTYNGSKNQYPQNEILPVSSAGVVDANGLMEMFYGEFNSDGTLKTSKETEVEGTTGNFVAFDLFFKTGTDTTLSLRYGNNFSKVVTTDKFGASDAGTQNAARVAFVNLGSAATAKDALKLKTEVDTKIWEPNAKVRANSIELSEVEEGKLAYKGVKAAAASLTQDDTTNLVDVTTITEDDGEMSWSLKAGINKMRIYVWLEGQDVDCVNDISFGDFTTDLYFSVSDEVAEG